MKLLSASIFTSSKGRDTDSHSHIRKGQLVESLLQGHLQSLMEILQIRNQMVFRNQIQMDGQTRMAFQTRMVDQFFFHRDIPLEWDHTHVYVRNDSRGILLFIYWVNFTPSYAEYEALEQIGRLNGHLSITERRLVNSPVSRTL